MTQIHKKFTAEQVKVLLISYAEGHLNREEIEKTLGIGKIRFFALLKQVRERPEFFSLITSIKQRTDRLRCRKKDQSRIVRRQRAGR
jgi:hypothetical protein